jgi:hypothetical protein
LQSEEIEGTRGIEGVGNGRAGPARVDEGAAAGLEEESGGAGAAILLKPSGFDLGPLSRTRITWYGVWLLGQSANRRGCQINNGQRSPSMHKRGWRSVGR